MFSAKIWFVKTSTRIVKYISRVIKSKPDSTSNIWPGYNHKKLVVFHWSFENAEQCK